jgi:cyclopropane fatty-acyl-phospholipid synthase-like methyltransferase
MNNDLFSHKADIYDKDTKRVSNVDNIANSIINNIALDQSMRLMDFGSGTGLLLERIAPYVSKITGVDVSSSMNSELLKKIESLPCELEVVEADLATEDLSDEYDGIISSMTMHHIEHIEPMFSKFYSHVRAGGFIAISDLDLEDGSFHTEDTGVHHFGFDRDAIIDAAKKANFQNIKILDASIVEKPHGKYPVFLLTAVKIV